jgi:hypothetical protein
MLGDCVNNVVDRNEDIDTWLTILEIVSFAAVVCNSGLVAFTGTNTINYPCIIESGSSLACVSVLRW